MSSEFLLSIPLKTSCEVVLLEALKVPFKEASYSVKDAALIASMEEFQKFRNQVVNKSLPKNAASLELLYRYHDQLVSLGARLPNMAHKPPNITIYWDDACDKGGLFGGKANITTSSFELERLCIIFNIAALQTTLAAESRAADTDEELKNAAKFYQSAASIMNFLSECKNPVLEGVTLTQDLKPEVLSALSALMLAQAQEVFIDKAIKDKMKETIIAKLCVQAEDMFSDAASKLSKDTIKHLWDRAWLNNVAAKKLGYVALSHYFQSTVCASKKQYGEQLARLDLFLRGVKKAQEKMGSSTYLAVHVADAELKYKDAKKDNDFIYNEVIPKEDDLAPIDKVGSARLSKLGTVPEAFSSHFVDIFINAVQKGGSHGGDGPTLKSIINTAAGSLGQYLVNMASKDKK
ncbi:apoptosis-linked gene 2-interacting protein X 1 [Folsomia candida]|uniref:Apoptosis-linked gene 2-interacting protein X 1 n=1 Tax=Folsomia candida TaxID=158441 RepID=A0A226EDL7_FOLCA|nr:apoptosis-linked gene 2-interacting protein X 1 [Folsomia candida]OXA55499.1 Apoptosis-linked gene 2-interacting protein X 1 [Folsomia candida]